MKVQVEVPEEVLQRATDQANRSKVAVAAVLGRMLLEHQRNTRGLQEGERILILGGEVLEQLEVRLGGGSILNQQDLWRKVDRLAGIQFQNRQLPFTPGMLEELTVRAERLSLTPEALIDRTAQKLYEQFFTHLKDW